MRERTGGARERENGVHIYEESGERAKEKEREGWGMEKRNQVSTFIGLRPRRVPPCLPCVRASFPSFLLARMQRRSVQATENHNH